MKIMHISDLHLGKIVNDINMIEDQKYVLEQVLEVIDIDKIEVLLIAGDIYDKSNPSLESMDLFNNFLNELSKKNIKTFIISGNHDSSTRLEYLSSFLEESNIFISKSFDGSLSKYELENNINIYLLPFFKLSQARNYLSKDFKNYDEAMIEIISNANIDKNSINILVAHQFVNGAKTCDSEEIIIGGLEGISYEVFKDFDYVALGHLHRPQKIIKDTIRYSGTLLKYSFSEINDKKSITIVNINDDIKIETKEIEVLRDMKEYKGSYEYLSSIPYTKDYVRIVLTDEEVLPDARINLSFNFPNMMRFSVENSKTNFDLNIKEIEKLENLSPIDLFRNFYLMQNNDVEPSEKQLKIINDLIIGEDI